MPAQPTTQRIQLTNTFEQLLRYKEVLNTLAPTDAQIHDMEETYAPYFLDHEDNLLVEYFYGPLCTSTWDYLLGLYFLAKSLTMPSYQEALFNQTHPHINIEDNLELFEIEQNNNYQERVKSITEELQHNYDVSCNLFGGFLTDQ